MPLKHEKYRFHQEYGNSFMQKLITDCLSFSGSFLCQRATVKFWIQFFDFYHPLQQLDPYQLVGHVRIC